MPAVAPVKKPAALGLFLSTAEAAPILCMCERSVRLLVAKDKLHAFRPCIGGKKYLLYTEEVLAYARAAQQPAHTAALANIAALRAAVSGK